MPISPTQWRRNNPQNAGDVSPEIATLLKQVDYLLQWPSVTNVHFVQSSDWTRWEQKRPEGVKIDQERRTWLTRLLSSHQVLRRIKVVDRRWDCQGQEVKGHVLRKETTSLKRTTGSVGTILQEYAAEQRLFVSTVKELGISLETVPSRKLTKKKRSQ